MSLSLELQYEVSRFRKGNMMKKISILDWSQLEPLVPCYVLITHVDLVVIRWQNEKEVSVLYGRCLHQGALLDDGYIDGDNIVCRLHGWDFNYKTGTGSFNSSKRLHRFTSWIEDEKVWVDEDEIRAWAIENPRPFFSDINHEFQKGFDGNPDEAYQYIQHLSKGDGKNNDLK